MGRSKAFTLAGVFVALLAAPSPARAAEVHTRGTAGTWSGNQQTGILRATIPNDGGWSFWLLDESFDLASGGAIIAQVRYASRVDYGGAGVALMDPAANAASQRHVRIELSERDDNAGVGGWLGNENTYGSGGGRRAGKDIEVGRWYELMLRIEGTRVTGYLDGTELWSGEIPELRSLPRLVAIAPFVIEADAEIKVTVYPGVRAAPSAPPGAPAGGAPGPVSTTASAKTQAEIEAAFSQRMRGVRSGTDVSRLFPSLEEFVLVVGTHHLVPDPFTRQWLHWDRVHQTWEPTRFGVGEATFEIIDGRLGVTKHRGARRR